ncbi:MAG: glycosyltransferase family 2 protein [Sphingomonadales bacterium]|nr:glycosyltransferase family 2 protein [Sphingomonadales bacterium]
MTVTLRPAFEVVTLALSPRRDIERFCQHYLVQGAHHIRVYCDGVPEAVAADSRIELIVCDGTFWAERGGERPFSVEERQRAVFRDAYARCRAEWCLIVDIDELVFGPVGLADYLPELDGSVDCVRFTSAEAVFLATDDADAEFAASGFRLPVHRLFSPLLAQLLYYPNASLYIRGLVGHSRGKQAIRRGIAGIEIGIHDAYVPGDPRFHRHDASRSADFWLAHFDAISFPRWSQKCRQRIAQRDALEMGFKREQQIALYEGCATPAQQRALFNRLYGLKRWQVAALKLLGLFRDRPAQLPIIGNEGAPICREAGSPSTPNPVLHGSLG